MGSTVGRKLVFDFGDHTMCIEIYPKGTSKYQVSNEKTGLLFDITEMDGEHIERLVGESALYPYGRDLSGLAPVNAPMAWMTQAEADEWDDVHPVCKVDQLISRNKKA